MDPNDALKNLRAALAAGNIEEAKDFFEALDEWLSKGGFFPSDWNYPGTRPAITM